MVEEGQAQLLRLDVDELTRMRDYLVGIRELTDRHRERLAAETGVPGEREAPLASRAWRSSAPTLRSRRPRWTPSAATWRTTATRCG